MADDASRASIAMHYAIMTLLVAWTVGLGVIVFHGFSPLEESAAVSSRPPAPTARPVPM
jgi:hypothetical protein